ncbi:hypothetical protein [Pleionea sediminis]|uniref:hypothetical protein n=1 Tax=Pleionea sediminis TaxID=2569479 RepID=UPI0011847310|nr:hypothetical protein [Pleionea sediminis]
MKITIKNILVSSALVVQSLASFAGGDSCPAVYKKAEIKLPFNPAFTEVDRFYDGHGLTVTSFYNKDIRVPGGFAERDLVARIPWINDYYSDNFDASRDMEIITDIDAAPGTSRTVWPNGVKRAPVDLVPFEAIIVAQGFLRTPAPGRLTLINISDPLKTEYVIHQSGMDGTMPTFYHDFVVHDMDGDGKRDIVSLRSSFNVILGTPPFGELVWFKNPGDALSPNTAWEEHLLVGGPTVGFKGPDTHLEIHDFENDGIPEIVTTHFFTGDSQAHGKIAIYGAPVGKNWADVNPMIMPARSATISGDQGLPFDIQIVDLNKDGRVDILATNHQPDACRPFPTVPGRVYALEMPESGDIFQDAWPVHILLDNIRPQPSLAGTQGLGRLAPGKATAFYMRQFDKYSYYKKPHIVVGGDEAGKVWVLTPTHNDWEYDSNVIFDINHHYGEGTTQTTTAAGVTVSTIGAVSVSYDNLFARANLFIPVFEGKEILVYTFNRRYRERVACVEDTVLACPAP